MFINIINKTDTVRITTFTINRFCILYTDCTDVIPVIIV